MILDSDQSLILCRLYSSSAVSFTKLIVGPASVLQLQQTQVALQLAHELTEYHGGTIDLAFSSA